MPVLQPKWDTVYVFATTCLSENESTPPLNEHLQHQAPSSHPSSAQYFNPLPLWLRGVFVCELKKWVKLPAAVTTAGVNPSEYFCFTTAWLYFTQHCFKVKAKHFWWVLVTPAAIIFSNIKIFWIQASHTVTDGERHQWTSWPGQEKSVQMILIVENF